MKKAYFFIINKYLFSSFYIDLLNNLSTKYDINFIINNNDENYINKLNELFDFKFEISNVINKKEIKNIIYNDIFELFIYYKLLNTSDYNIINKEPNSIIEKYKIDKEQLYLFNLVDNKVLEYVKNNNFIDEQRFNHSYSVSIISYMISLHYLNIDYEKLLIAGLFHDIGRNNFNEDLAKTNPNYHKISKYALHQYTSAELYKNYYKDNISEEIYNAISCHCTGKGNMNIYDKLLFYADKYDILRYIDTQEKLCEVDKNIELAYKDFNLAFKLLLKDQINYFKKKGYDYLNNELSKKLYNSEDKNINLKSIIYSFNIR